MNSLRNLLRRYTRPRAAIQYCLLAVAGVAVAASAVAGESQPMRALVEADWIDRDAQFTVAGAVEKAVSDPSPKRNAEGVTTTQDAAGGCDGIKNGRWGFHTASGEQDAWWQVDLGKPCKLDRVVVYNRVDGTMSRTRNIRVLTADTADSRKLNLVYQHDGTPFGGIKKNDPLVVDLKGKNVTAQIVQLYIPGRCSFALDEVEVYAVDDPKKNIALGKPADQKSVNRYSYPGTLDKDVMTAAQQFAKSGRPTAVEGGNFTLAHACDVVDRAKKLAERIRVGADPKRLAPPLAKLATLDVRLAKLKKSGKPLDDVRRQVYLEARSLLREIAFCNPLLKMDKILFLKRHDSVGVFHMCDQYYGCNAKPGGGLFVLHDAFGPNPRAVDLLKNSVVEKGRLAGKKLQGGTFLSPDLSYDGRTILFAYSEAGAYAKYQGKWAYEWTPECSYHIFKVNVDGTGLVQLTDGTTNDFDPCFLPNGRIAFVTERRGGYLRCGRNCPVYTLYSMEPDGSDIICLSYHETHEWQPSVDNNGMIVYTRWDYVDRDTNVAHHIWSCYPDGRDPRSFHGNYPADRASRPWMEMSIRAIPGSHKYVATTGAHHGHAFGSLVLIDYRREDDGAMSQLTRLTPDVAFPESSAGKGNIRQLSIYGTAWPLSEDDYLCVYDRHVKNRGIYWLDRFGNKELIYRDPSISCLSPIPLRPRPMPRVIPERTTQTLAAKKAAGGDRPATVAVMNVYDSDFEWPEDTTITHLRIIQLLPKATNPPDSPRIGIARQTNARSVLGSVPVETDGSAFFKAPVGKLIYFQALDRRGMAVQSMRSATYVHPGERLTCQGCHEHKRRPPSTPQTLPLALRRAPSQIEPDAGGSNPFNYVRLVQPVLDRNCVGCHQEKKALDLTGTIEGSRLFTRSYNNLADKYGFYFTVYNGSIKAGIHGGSRTIAGEFGAKASALLKYMGPKHHGVKLSEEDYHRLTLWLDCNSEFLGAYENAEAQARGEVVVPSLE